MLINDSSGPRRTARCGRFSQGSGARGAAEVGFGRIVAFYYRSSTLHQIHHQIRYLYF
jgi:hypothetical protein